MGVLLALGGCNATHEVDPPPATLSLYLGTFALDYIVTPSDGQLEGVTLTTAGNSTGFVYSLAIADLLGVGSGGDTENLGLTGQVNIPAASTAAGTLDGVTGTINSIEESYDGFTFFRIDGLHADAAKLQAAWAAGDVPGFWHEIAQGGTDILASAQSEEGGLPPHPTAVLYCTSGATGVPSGKSIQLSENPVSIKAFLLAC
jgi:hypothetical protein